MSGSDFGIANGPESPEGESPSSLRMMVVGLTKSEVKATGADLTLTNFLSVAFADVTVDLIASFDPEIVFSTLFSAEFDALDLARLLLDAGFSGQYRAIAIGLRNAKVVCTEVRAEAPGIDFDVFQVDAP